MTIRKIDGSDFDMFNIKLRNKKVHKSYTNYDTCRTITLCGIDLDFRDKDIIKDYKATNRKSNCKTCNKIRYKYNDIEGLERCK